MIWKPITSTAWVRPLLTRAQARGSAAGRSRPHAAGWHPSLTRALPPGTEMGLFTRVMVLVTPPTTVVTTWACWATVTVPDLCTVMMGRVDVLAAEETDVPTWAAAVFSIRVAGLLTLKGWRRAVSGAGRRGPASAQRGPKQLAGLCLSRTHGARGRPQAAASRKVPTHSRARGKRQLRAGGPTGAGPKPRGSDCCLNTALRSPRPRGCPGSEPGTRNAHHDRRGGHLYSSREGGGAWRHSHGFDDGRACWDTQHRGR